jgi:hypothetical protein
VIDAVLRDQHQPNLVCVEVESAIRRLEATLRWGEQKAHALLASGPMDVDARRPPLVSRVLALPSTRANREVVATFRQTLHAAFPASCSDVHQALTTSDVPWPGSGLLWFRVEGNVAHALPHTPRGLSRACR